MATDSVNKQLEGVGKADEQAGYFSNVSKVTYMPMDDTLVFDFSYLCVSINEVPKGKAIGLRIDKNELAVGQRIVMSRRTAEGFLGELAGLMDRVRKNLDVQPQE